jgi:hypothetical protein
MEAEGMTNRLETLKQDFELLFREHKKYVLVDEVGLFVSGCGCRGLRVRPGGLRTDVLDLRGEQINRLLIDVCSSYGVKANLGYVQMVYGSRDLVDCLYMVDACRACRTNVEESGGLAPIAVFYNPLEQESNG